MGASGSGKDSILRYCRKHNLLSKTKPVVVAHRYITRASDSSENAINLSEEEFELRKSEGLFALHWQANRCQYGIGVELDSWLSKGVSVILNGSRGYLATAKNHYDCLHSINIKVADEVLIERITSRNRESSTEITERISRHKKLSTTVTADSTIENNRSLEEAALSLQKIIDEH